MELIELTYEQAILSELEIAAKSKTVWLDGIGIEMEKRGIVKSDGHGCFWGNHYKITQTGHELLCQKVPPAEW
jgi:hypothetical protein